MSKTYTWEEVAQHKTKTDCWVVFEGKVLNISNFLSEHPGGEEVIMDHAGKDITQPFEDIGHSENAKELTEKYVVGKVDGPAPSLKKANPNSGLNNPAKPVTKPAQGGSSTTILLLALVVAILAYYLYSK
jgi:cytochrome b involved in lipid metabolism